ncbi:MAG TPA: response regulator, partial [Candidatus Acidoferrales bacterium]|nr:response regulator [Candidatus Acidoferrales bacterium]
TEKSIKVLLIEDNPLDARLIEVELNESGVAKNLIRTVPTLSEALTALAADSFDVLLTDLSLPDADPAETLERVTGAASRTPIVVLTGLDDEEFGRAALKLGAQDYLVKGQFDARLLGRSIGYAIERKRIEIELAAARDAAVEASNHKSEFLANISHEIRTPMNAIVGMTELLFDTELSSEQREFVGTVRSSGQALLAILDDILDFTKIASGKLDLNEALFNPAQVVEGVIELLGESSHTTGVRLISFVDGAVPVGAVGDAGRLRQVLINLVGNALKFTERGEVAVLARAESETHDEIKLHFTVNDTGPGVRPEMLPQLFEPVHESSQPADQRRSGIGLGLTLSARLVEMMGGKIGVESALGDGSSFWFSARFRKPPGGLMTQQQRYAALAGMRALIVSTDAGVAQWLRRQIAAWGLDCGNAISGAEAADAVARARSAGEGYDFAVLDLPLAGVDSFELARSIRGDSKQPTPRLYAIHEFGKRPDEVALRAAGFFAWTTKPVRQSVLFDHFVDAAAPAGEKRSLPPQEPEAGTSAFSTTVPEEVRKRTRILLAEDHRVDQRVLEKMLERLGYRVDVVRNGREAVDAIRHTDYGVVLMDCQMPELDGYGATREIRYEFRGMRPIVIVGITASALRGDRQKCLDAGMDDYLSKPVRPEELESMLARWLAPGHGGDSKRSAADAIPREPATDTAALARLAEIAPPGSNFMAEIIDAFLGDLTKRLGAVEQQMSVRDTAGIAATGHSLKGSCSHFGARRLMQLCVELEDIARSGKTDGLRAAVDSVVAESERVRTELQEHRNTQASTVVAQAQAQ